MRRQFLFLPAAVTLSRACSLGLQARTQVSGRVQNKGYREQPPIPDRLKDAFSQFGCDPNQTNSDVDPNYVPEEDRQRVLQEITSSTANIKNYNKMDRLRTALDNVHNKPIGDTNWLEVYLFLRSTELCTELMKVPDDKFPQGQKLWIELQYCEERRVPPLLALPTGMLVLPVFSMEEYMDQYFCLVNAFESCWFPVPRTGSTRWKEFCELEFPVAATGGLQHYSTLATVAYPHCQFAMLVNPGQRSSKFITYPEMVEMAKIKQAASKERNLSLREKNEDGTLSDRFVFDSNLMKCYDTRKMPMRRVKPHEVARLMERRPRIPAIAQMELQLLLCSYPEIAYVYVRTTERPRWRTVLGASQRMTQIDVLPAPGQKPPREFFEHLERWSYMREFQMDVHVELTDVAPAEDAENCMCLYRPEDGEMLRAMATFTGITLPDSLDYNSPIVDANGRQVYEPYGNYK